ncbi:hypothetical protein EWB00_002580 [Schistosoma japonicum]|uniref:Uncharacterized protein n=1 Tax=Schistosoma japonicum TaxID=6182 RepID=A0A4Z2DBR2_SCHJA|nr:hypothetical protein EWB00_002580 [Schistosoma japonicum]
MFYESVLQPQAVSLVSRDSLSKLSTISDTRLPVNCARNPRDQLAKVKLLRHTRQFIGTYTVHT